MPPQPITVLVAIANELDAEAYAARINQQPGWRAHLPGGAAEWDVALADRCVTPGKSVVIAAGAEVPCVCCPPVGSGAGWDAIFSLLSKACGRTADAPSPGELEGLTPRELDVLRLVGRGLSVGECAEDLGVTASTIGNHKYRLMRKLGAKTSLQLLRIAVRNGLASFE